MKKPDLEVLAFESPRRFAAWLAKHHTRPAGIWLRFFKKDSGRRTVTYAEALDAALCYGWIDGQVKRLDELSYLQRFTPRRPRSLWSRRNREHVERLTAAGRMKPAGLEQVEAARRDGRWESAYDSPAGMTVPEDFLHELAEDPKAEAFFRTLNRANTYAIAWRLQTAARPQTRQKRMRAILDMLAQGKKLHS